MNDKKKYSIGDVDDIQFRMKCGISAVRTIHEAIETGTCSPEIYTDALYGACDYLWMLNDQLRKIVDGMPAERKVGAV